MINKSLQLNNTTPMLRTKQRTSLQTLTMMHPLSNLSKWNKRKKRRITPRLKLPLVPLLLLQQLFLRLNRPSSSFYKNSNLSLKERKPLLDRPKRKIVLPSISLL
jgi:hypothetical protein